MNDNIAIITVVEQLYHTHITASHRLRSDNDNRVYQLDLADGQSWILRIFSAEDQSVSSLADILSFLEQQSYPAEQIVYATNNETIVRHEDVVLLMTRFVEGSPIDYSPSTLYLLGKTLGCLHAVIVGDRTALPMAAMLPAPELSYALAELTKVADSVPRALQQHYDRLANAIHSLNRCENTPLVIIHNDCHPGNAIRISAENVVLIDWLGAGLGSAVIDVGFLLVSCEIPFSWTPSFVPNVERIPAIINGYCQHHNLTSCELDLLPDAIRFRSLVYGAVSFVNAISKHEVVKYDSQWWWIRYNAADEIAAKARKYFEKYI